MRRTRRLILLLILAIAVAVGFIYIKQKTTQAKAAPPIPDSLPTGTSAKLNGWSYTKDEGNRSAFRIHATGMRETAEGNRYELEGVDLRVFHKRDDAFDKVTSQKALFDKSDGVLYSEGDVEIALGVPSGDQPKPSGKLLLIKSSGVRYDSKTGKAFTERAATFTFDRGEGKATGAEYDPVTGEVRMFKDVSLTMHPRTPKGKAMTVEAILPDGSTQLISHVGNFNFNWMTNYIYADDAAPVLPKGTMIHVTAWYDNTRANPNNPDPDQWVGYGDRTVDEMGHAWMNVTYLSDDEYNAYVAKRKGNLQASDAAPRK